MPDTFEPSRGRGHFLEGSWRIFWRACGWRLVEFRSLSPRRGDSESWVESGVAAVAALSGYRGGAAAGGCAVRASLPLIV